MSQLDKTQKWCAETLHTRLKICHYRELDILLLQNFAQSATVFISTFSILFPTVEYQ